MSGRISNLPEVDLLNQTEWIEVIQLVDGVYKNHKVFLPDIQVSLRLVTARRLPITPEGRAALPTAPQGDFLHDLALVFLSDGSVVEMDDLTHVVVEGEHFVQLNADDAAAYQGEIEAITVSFLAVVAN